MPVHFNMPHTFPKFIKRAPRLMIALLVGLITYWIVHGLFQLGTLADILISWDAIIWIYLVLLWQLLISSDQKDIHQLALKHDEKLPIVLLTFIIGAVCSLIASILLLKTGKIGVGAHMKAHMLLTLVTLTGSWSLLPTLFTLHYAHLFYLNENTKHPTIIFPDNDGDGVRPDYLDFAYFSFTIAVASQTADIALGNRQMRRLVLIQSIQSFVFNTSLLGLTINILASVF